MSQIVMQMSRVKQRYQDIYVEQRQFHASSRRRFTSAMVVSGAPAGRSIRRIPLRIDVVRVGFMARRRRSEIALPAV